MPHHSTHHASNTAVAAHCSYNNGCSRTVAPGNGRPCDQRAAPAPNRDACVEPSTAPQGMETDEHRQLPVFVPTSRIPHEINVLDDDTTCSQLSIRADLNEFKQAIMSEIDNQVARIYELNTRMADMDRKLDAILEFQRNSSRAGPTQ